MGNFNDKHAASIGYVNDAVVNAFEKMQVWVTTHADQLEYVFFRIRFDWYLTH